MPEALAADHAGSVLCRLLMAHPQVVDIEIVGQAELSDGVITYSLGVMLPGGRPVDALTRGVWLPGRLSGPRPHMRI